MNRLHPAAPVSRFTLIELLVVVAIIAVLASLLLPALSRARAMGLTTDCLGRQHNLAIAVNGYRDDYDSWFPPNYPRGDVGPNWSGVARFPTLMMPYLQLTNIGIYTTAKTNLLMCPANNYSKGTKGYSEIRYFTYCPGSSIAVNYWNSVKYGGYNHWAAEDGPKRVESAAPSTTLFSGEGGGNGCSLGYVTGGIHSLLYFHPGDSANLLIEDGHVQSLRQGTSLAQAGLHFYKK